MNAAGPTKGHLERLSDGRAPEEHGVHPVRGQPLCSYGRGKQLLLQDLLYVHRKARDADP